MKKFWNLMLVALVVMLGATACTENLDSVDVKDGAGLSFYAEIDMAAEEQITIAGIGPALGVAAHLHLVHSGAQGIHGGEDNISVILGVLQRVGGELVLTDSVLKLLSLRGSLGYKPAQLLSQLQLIRNVKLGAKCLLAARDI